MSDYDPERERPKDATSYYLSEIETIVSELRHHLGELESGILRLKKKAADDFVDVTSSEIERTKKNIAQYENIIMHLKAGLIPRTA